MNVIKCLPMKTYLFVLVSFMVLPLQFIQAKSNEINLIQQDRTASLKGRVTDTGGDPLAGATIQIKGSTRGVLA